ncbi:U3 protein [Ekpoma virus 1]|uniref:U3 protein n=1 Tax=Ekpoma virus 1 TaxID=1987020 RepID=A0A0C5BVK9_9RHAB|nr:U3 protein [Ekpoma virus 1]AJN08916.1 U3 protein [Ekpoma virus 1]
MEKAILTELSSFLSSIRAFFISLSPYLNLILAMAFMYCLAYLISSITNLLSQLYQACRKTLSTTLTLISRIKDLLKKKNKTQSKISELLNEM